MPIPNLVNELNDAFSGLIQAQRQLNFYIENKSFSLDEIETISTVIDERLSGEDNEQRGYALYLKGFWCEVGINGEVNQLQAITFYKEAIQLGSAWAMNNLGMMYQHSLQRFSKAIELYDAAIMKNNTSAMVNRAYIYQQGFEGRGRNPTMAIKLLSQASELGDMYATTQLAKIYEQQGDTSAAITLYETLVSHGDTSVVENLSALKLKINPDYQKFLEAIHVLHRKMVDFSMNPEFYKGKDKKVQDAYHAAWRLQDTLRDEGKIYFAKSTVTQADYLEFRDKCKEHLDKAKLGVLGDHRGWLKICVNVFAIIVTAGIGYAIAAGINMAVNKGRFTFFDTDSTKKLHDIEDYINEEAKNFSIQNA